MQLFRKTVVSPVGDITIISTFDSIISLSFGKDNCDAWLDRYIGENQIAGESPLLTECESELARYFNGMLKKFTIPFKLYGTPFQIKIWNALLKIPYGQTTTYAGIAVMAGEGGARAAGGALSKNPIPIIVPCHRVIRSDRTLGGFGSGFEKTDIKEALLRHEGADFSPLK